MGQLGAWVLDADQTAHQVLTDPEVIASLTDWWGDSVLGSDGQIDRARVAQIVFEDPKQRRRLENLIHPRVFARWAETLQRCRSEPGFAPAVVIDAPLLFECGLDSECDVIVFVDVPEEIRARRVQEGRGWSLAELRRREKMQKSLDIKRDRADHIVENNSSVSDLRRTAENAFTAIISSGR